MYCTCRPIGLYEILTTCEERRADTVTELFCSSHQPAMQGLRAEM